jgi:hypothetical protein
MLSPPNRGASSCSATHPTCTNPEKQRVIPSLVRAGFLRKLRPPGINGRPPPLCDVRSALIGGSLAETAETPPLRPPPNSALIGISLAEIAEIAGKQDWAHGTPIQPPCGTFGGQ